MDIDSYEINKNTYAVLNISPEISKVLEEDNEYILPKTTYEVMEDSCNYYGSTYDGRLKGTKKILGSTYKLPIIVEETNGIIFFPTTGTNNEKCCWISLNNIKSYTKYRGFTKVVFKNNKAIIVKMPYSSFELQLLRATRLQQLLHRRINDIDIITEEFSEKKDTFEEKDEEI